MRSYFYVYSSKGTFVRVFKYDFPLELSLLLTRSSVNEACEETAPKNVSSFAHQVVHMDTEASLNLMTPHNLLATVASITYGNVLNKLAQNESLRNSVAR